MLPSAEKFFMSVQSSLLKRMFKMFWYFTKNQNCETRSVSQEPFHEYYCINNKKFKLTCTRNSPCLCTKRLIEFVIYGYQLEDTISVTDTDMFEDILQRRTL